MSKKKLLLVGAGGFGRMVAALGGPTDFLQRYDNYLQTAPYSRPLLAGEAGFVSAMDTRAIGLSVVALGGGRLRASDTIDYRVGLTDFCTLGQAVSADQPLLWIHARDEQSWQEAAQRLRPAIQLASTPAAANPEVYRRITAADVA